MWPDSLLVSTLLRSVEMRLFTLAEVLAQLCRQQSDTPKEGSCVCWEPQLLSTQQENVHGGGGLVGFTPKSSHPTNEMVKQKKQLLIPLQIKILGKGPTPGVPNVHRSTSPWLRGLNHLWAPGQQSSKSQICALHNRFSLVHPETLHFWGSFYAYEILLGKPRWKIHRYLLRQELVGLCLHAIFLTSFFSRLGNLSVNPKPWGCHANLWHILHTSL